jgi:hydrogenase expression/formation protein HypC
MCLAIPGKLLDIELDANGVRMGRANFGGIVKQVCLEYTPDAAPATMCSCMSASRWER